MHLYVLTASVTHIALSFLHLSPLSISVITVWMSGLLFLLNIVLAVLFRRKSRKELLSYAFSCLIELAIFVFALLFALKIVTSVPYHLPPGLQFNRAEIGATIAIAVGLFPAAYWHRTSWSDMTARMAQDAKVLEQRNGGVRVRKNAPGEWMN